MFGIGKGQRTASMILDGTRYPGGGPQVQNETAGKTTELEPGFFWPKKPGSGSICLEKKGDV